MEGLTGQTKERRLQEREGKREGRGNQGASEAETKGRWIDATTGWIRAVWIVQSQMGEGGGTGKTVEFSAGLPEGRRVRWMWIRPCEA